MFFFNAYIYSLDTLSCHLTHVDGYGLSGEGLKCSEPMLPDIELLKDVKGFLDHEEGRRLYLLALEAGSYGPCLEIGSYCGKSALYLGAACRENQTVLFSIDHHHGSEEQQPGQAYFDPELWAPQSGTIDTFSFFRRSIERAGLEDVVLPVVCRSADVARVWRTPLGTSLYRWRPCIRYSHGRFYGMGRTPGSRGVSTLSRYIR